MLPDLRVIYSSEEMEPGSVMMRLTFLNNQQDSSRPHVLQKIKREGQTKKVGRMNRFNFSPLRMRMQMYADEMLRAAWPVMSNLMTFDRDLPEIWRKKSH